MGLFDAAEAALADLEARVAALEGVAPPVEPPPPADGITLSVSHAGIGDELTITGSGFGAEQGTSKVWFGELPVTSPTPTGPEEWAPCTKEAASYVSWSDTEIVVTVPSMSPGAVEIPLVIGRTHHPVYTEVGGQCSERKAFYIDPAVTNPSSTAHIAYSVAGDNEWHLPARTANADTTGGVQGYDYVSPVGSAIPNSIRGSNVLFQNCTFTCNEPDLPGDWVGVVSLGQGVTLRNVTFLNCTLKENWSTNTVGDAWKGVNGVKIYGNVQDVTISDCTFERFSRMSVEVINGYGADNPRRLAIKNCTFEPPGNQVLSFGSRQDLYSIVEDCLFKGWGNHAAMYPNGSPAWESNGGRYIVTRRCTWWRGTQECINVSGYETASYLYFDDCDLLFDSAHHYAEQRDDIFAAPMIAANGMYYARFKDCRFITGDATEAIESMGLTDWGTGPIQWAATDDHNDFTGSTVTGYVTQGGAHVPATAADYFDTRGTVLPGNVLPAKV